MAPTHVLTWEVLPSRGCETAWVEVGEGSLWARGRAMGLAPEPYWLSYELWTGRPAGGEGYVTRELRVRAETARATYELLLARDADGRWTADGRELPELAGAFDCDLGMCPLTNTMPVRRYGLHRGPGDHELLMAWVAVPELTVQPMTQRYTHLRTSASGAVVRYASEGFSSEIRCDGDGLVRDYPQIARRVAEG